MSAHTSAHAIWETRQAHIQAHMWVWENIKTCGRLYRFESKYKRTYKFLYVRFFARGSYQGSTKVGSVRLWSQQI